MRIPRGYVASFIIDFITYQLSSLRGGQSILPLMPGNSEEAEAKITPFTKAPWFMDSLELVTLSGMIAEVFHVREVGIEDMLLAQPTVDGWTEVLETSLAHYDQKLTFFTSGSTGTAKAVTHNTALLREEVATLAGMVRELIPGTPKRILSTVPRNHIYGFLFTIMLPLELDIPVTRISGLTMNLEDGDILITIPNLLQLWWQNQSTPPEHGLIVSSTAPLGAELASWLDTGRVAWMEIYGSSETAGIAHRTSADPYFTLLPYWTPGKDSQSLERPGLDAPVPLPDLVDWNGPSKLRPMGRQDQAIQVGGINVFPTSIAQSLESLPEIAAARVRGFQTPAGTRLKAFLVPRQTSIPHQELETRVRQWASEHLPAASRPGVYTIGVKIPQNSMGKDSDWEIT
jgi:4-coumarate--CoA ligase